MLIIIHTASSLIPQQMTTVLAYPTMNYTTDNSYVKLDPLHPNQVSQWDKTGKQNDTTQHNTCTASSPHINNRDGMWGLATF